MENGKHSLETEEKVEEKRELGLHTISHGYNKEINETITKVVDGSLRSGRKVEFEGSLVIIGDVNAGAEVIAADHIIVLGSLRGLAHAGAKGNRKAMIVANEIDAPQIRIADIVKEIERPVFDEEIDEEKEEKSKKKETKKQEEQEEEEFDYYIKTRAYVENGDIILE